MLFTNQPLGYLNQCVRAGNLLFTSGHVSEMKGKLGADLVTMDGYAAARDCAAKTLSSVWNCFGSLDELRVVRLLGCVNSTPDFCEQHLVVNGASDLIHAIFGTQSGSSSLDGALGYDARSALGFVSLPLGAAVEIEAIFEVISS